MATITETSDASGNRATVYSMGLGDVFLGSLSAADSDWVRVTLTAGQTVTMGAVGLGGFGEGLSDPILRLMKQVGTTATEVARNDDGGPGNTPLLTYTPTESGTYYLNLRGYDVGTYGLTLNAGSRLSLTTELAAGMLYREDASWSWTPGTGVNLTWGLRASGPAFDANGDPAPFSQLAASQQTALKAALGAFAEVSGLTFTQVNPDGFTDDATILVGNYDSTTDGAGAYAYYPGSTAASSVDGDLWLNLDSVSTTDFKPGSYSWYTLLHELGHAMGLAHPGDYNAAPGVSITYANSAQYVQDSGQYTVMSYFDAVDTTAAAPAVYAQTLMMHDIKALQVMYGVNSSVRSGTDVYGFNATAKGSVYDFATNTTPLLCIWDGGGSDTLDLSNTSRAQRIDLRGGTFSDVLGFVNNLSIAEGTVIENATGGRGADVITGNAAANVLRGGAGADRIAGGAGSDRMFGGAGADRFVFAKGDGYDRVMDFSLASDILELGSALWGSVAKTAAEVVTQYSVLRGGHVVLDFGVDEIHLMNLTATTGLEGRLLLV